MAAISRQQAWGETEGHGGGSTHPKRLSNAYLASMSYGVPLSGCNAGLNKRVQAPLQHFISFMQLVSSSCEHIHNIHMTTGNHGSPRLSQPFIMLYSMTCAHAACYSTSLHLKLAQWLKPVAHCAATPWQT
eukprot:6464649-Amphidinium_carterae.2